MLFLFRTCQFFAGCGLLSMVLVTADEIFGLGIWPNGYPAGETNARGEAIGSSYGHFMLVAVITVVVATLLGSFLAVRMRRREERAILFLEMLELAEAEEEEEALREDTESYQ